MDKVFKLTERIYKNQLIAFLIGFSIIVVLVVLRFCNNLISQEKFSGFTWLTVIVIIFSIQVVKKHNIIGSILIGPEMIMTKINGEIERFKFDTNKPEYIRFVYYGFKGDYLPSALFKAGPLIPFSGAFNRIEFLLNGDRKNYCFLLENKFRFESLKDLVSDMRKAEFNIYIDRKV